MTLSKASESDQMEMGLFDRYEISFGSPCCLLRCTAIQTRDNGKSRFDFLMQRSSGLCIISNISFIKICRMSLQQDIECCVESTSQTKDNSDYDHVPINGHYKVHIAQK